MHWNKLRNLFYLQTAGILLAGAFACNSKTEDEPDVVVTSSNIAVTAFSIQSDLKRADHLEDVAFSIDLDHGVIFNADSLPKGTKVDRLIPTITFANTMKKADLSYYKDNRVDTASNYLENPTDSIDFTQPVKLIVTAENGTTNFTYTIKINIHTVVPDTMEWAAMSTSPLPSRMENPRAQKTLMQSSNVYCLIEEKDGSYTLSSSDDLNKADWMKVAIEPGFTMNLENFTCTENDFYCTDTDGNIWISEDGIAWIKTGETWITILGAYQGCILGIKTEEDGYYHAKYPADDNFIPSPIEEDFPIYHSSPLYELSNSWSDLTTAILAGGVTQSGKYSNFIWGYDGKQWATINSTPLPGLEAPMLVKYTVYKDTEENYELREFDGWLLFGGRLSGNSSNRKVYVSYDNGVIWSEAPSGLQLPRLFPDVIFSDAIVASYPLTANLSDAWEDLGNVNSRGSYTLDGTEITWDCPYIYVFGGYSSTNTLMTRVWRGVLNRVKFTPLI